MPLAEMASAVAAIVATFPDTSPSALIERLCSTLQGTLTSPQHEAILYAILYGLHFQRESISYLFRDIEQAFTGLPHFDVNILAAMIRVLLERLSEQFSRTSRRDL